jgi:hypothetical protein
LVSASKDMAIDLKKAIFFARWWIDLRFADVGEAVYYSVQTRLS